jgi:hypothetical protein
MRAHDPTLDVRWVVVRLQVEAKVNLISKASRQTMESIATPIQWVRWISPPGKAAYLAQSLEMNGAVPSLIYMPL